MKWGSILRNKTTGQIGSLHYSSFGGSVHIWSEEYNALCKTLGEPISEIEKDWEVCRKMPKGYEWDKSKLYVRKANNADN